MSPSTAGDQQVEIEIAVRNRSQFATTLHRPEEGVDEPQPACVESDCRDDAEFTKVSVATHPTYDLCQNPSCFGSEWW